MAGERICTVLILACGACGAERGSPSVATKEELGALLFNDPTLSEPAGQGCVDCHHQSAAFADPQTDRTSVGVVRDRFGPRNTQSAMYAALIPPLHANAQGRMVGGLFWDGRASSLEAQAALPLLNPLEMNNPDKATVVRKVRANHGASMRRVFGADVFADTDAAFTRITEAIAAFERTRVFSPFSSKYDRYLAGTEQLAERELRGLALFEDPARGNCASCHPSRPAADGTPPLFSTFGYDNLGIPVWADNPFYSLPPPLNPEGLAFVDHGLAKTTGNPQHEGMFRIPSLRNVARTTPYGHNGYIRRLPEIVELMAKRGGALSERDIVDISIFLETLTDADVIHAPPPPPE